MPWYLILLVISSNESPNFSNVLIHTSQSPSFKADPKDIKAQARRTPNKLILKFDIFVFYLSKTTFTKFNEV